MLSFQKLDVYRCSIEFLARSVSLPEVLPRGHAVLADPLRRAALSVPLNIAEPQAGRPSPIRRGTSPSPEDPPWSARR